MTQYRAPWRFLLASIVWVSILSGCSHSVHAPKHADVENGHHHHDHHHEFNTGDGPVMRAWIKDDYEQARAAAEQANVPLVIDIWAKWCGPCIEMHHRVSRDAHMVAKEKQFVWLMLDTDVKANDFSFHLFKTERWPTFLVVNPYDEQVLSRLEGAQAMSQFNSFLTSGLSRFKEALPDNDADKRRFKAVRFAKRALFRGELETAADGFEEAFELSTDFVERAALLKSWIWTLHDDGNYDTCQEVAAQVVESASLTSVELDIVEMSLECGAKEKELDEDVAKVVSAYLETHGADTLLLKNRRLKLLRRLYVKMGNTEAAHQTALKQRALLDQAAEHTTSDQEALRWDRARAEVYLYLKEPQKLLPLLKSRAEDASDAFEPHANLAWLAMKMGDLEQAVESARTAVSLAPDPERGEVLFLFAEIVHSQGDRKTEGEVRRFLVEYYETLPAVLAPVGALRRAKGELSLFEQSSL